MTFNVTHRNISFLIGGGNFPNQECINLVIQGQVVRTARLPQALTVRN